MRSHRPKLLLLLPLLAGLNGCWDRRPQATALTVDRTSPVLSDPKQPVLLNDALTVYFSAPIQPRSVNEDSVVLMDENGHQVRGEVEVGTDWIAFVPAAPLAKDLSDGSFQPGGHYRLHLSGQPRFSRIRAQGGGSLSETRSFDVYVATRDQRPEGLPEIMRPLASDLPLMLLKSDVSMHVAADAPRLQLHFTMPLLPTSVSAESFEIRLLDPAVELVPRRVRVVNSPLDDHPGSTVEIDLGAIPKAVDGSQVRLGEGDFISVKLLAGNGLVDYAGQPPLPANDPRFWTVVEGRSLPICEWPASGEVYANDDALEASFEVRGSTIRPRVRVEAGNGNLGVFRPKQNVTLRPGVAFDRGDGQQVVSNGAEFAFAAIDVPAGIEVTIDAQDGPVRLLASGGIRISGSVRLLGAPTPLLPRYTQYPVAELIDAANVSLVAAGDIEVGGEILSAMAVAETQSALLLATAGSLRLRGTLPFQTILAPDAADEGTGGGPSASRIEGVRGQTLLYQGRFTPGLAEGSDFEVVGMLPWRQLPAHLDSGVLEIGGLQGDLAVSWQATSADAIRGEHPDLSPGRVGRWQPARDGEVLVVGAGSFVRMKLATRVRDGEPLPSVAELRLVQN